MPRALSASAKARNVVAPAFCASLMMGRTFAACWSALALMAVTLQRGFDLPTSARRAGSVPVVSSSGITGSHDEAKVQAPGVVIGRYGTLGEVHFVSMDYAVNA
jgi:hypothetical protein